MVSDILAASLISGNDSLRSISRSAALIFSSRKRNAGDGGALLIAARNGDEDTVRRLIQHGVDVNEYGELTLNLKFNGMQTIHLKAAMKGRHCKLHLFAEI